mmetsp:Transcript_70455/g.166056  ORF Transcript_70455/g.166056 Transcript_70455/m.166056 type:complete len:218 (+) Transcript_70455:813-1466(+)
MAGAMWVRMRRASSAGSVTVAAFSAMDSTMERMSRMWTPSSSSSWSTRCRVAMLTIFGITSSINCGACLVRWSTSDCASTRPRSLAACTCIKCERWVATTVEQSTTVKPLIWAISFCRSSIQKAGSPNAGSVVGVPISFCVACPGLMASHMPGKASASPTTAPRSEMRYWLGLSSRLSRICTGGGRKPTSCANLRRTPLMRLSRSPSRVLSTRVIKR